MKERVEEGTVGAAEGSTTSIRASHLFPLLLFHCASRASVSARFKPHVVRNGRVCQKVVKVNASENEGFLFTTPELNFARDLYFTNVLCLYIFPTMHKKHSKNICEKYSKIKELNKAQCYYTELYKKYIH